MSSYRSYISTSTLFKHLTIITQSFEKERLEISNPFVWFQSCVENPAAICGYLSGWLLVLCSAYPTRGCVIYFCSHQSNKRLPLVNLTSGQSNQSEWWWGGYALINIIIPRAAEQRTLPLSSFVIPSRPECVCAPLWDFSLMWGTNDPGALLSIRCVVVCLCPQNGKSMNHSRVAGICGQGGRKFIRGGKTRHPRSPTPWQTQRRRSRSWWTDIPRCFSKTRDEVTGLAALNREQKKRDEPKTGLSSWSPFRGQRAESDCIWVWQYSTGEQHGPSTSEAFCRHVATGPTSPKCAAVSCNLHERRDSAQGGSRVSAGDGDAESTLNMESTDATTKH